MVSKYIYEGRSTSTRINWTMHTAATWATVRNKVLRRARVVLRQCPAMTRTRCRSRTTILGSGVQKGRGPSSRVGGCLYGRYRCPSPFAGVHAHVTDLVRRVTPTRCLPVRASIRARDMLRVRVQLPPTYIDDVRTRTQTGNVRIHVHRGDM